MAVEPRQPMSSKATQEETTFPDTHRVGSYDQDEVKGIVNFHEMRNNNIDAYVAVWKRSSDPTALKILRTVYMNGGCEYGTLYDVTSCTKKTVRNKVKSMCEDNILDKQGKPAHIDFESETVRILVSDALNALEESNVSTD